MTTIYSASLAKLDASASPFLVVPSTAGEGAPGIIRHVGDFVTVPASAGTGTIFRVLRIPVTTHLKSLITECEAMGAGKFQLGLYYSDSIYDGTQPANQGLVVPSCVDFFASDVDCSSAVVRTGIYLNANAKYPVAKRNSALWVAAGLATNPGGFFDICATVHTTAVTTGAANLSIEAEVVE